MPELTEIYARVPQPLRRASQIDRILIEETVEGVDGRRTRRALDLHAGCQPGDPFFGVFTDAVPPDALVEIDAYLSGVEIERANLQGARVGDKGLARLIDTSWLQAVREINLGDNKLTSRGIGALLKSPLAARLRALRLANDKVGGALDKLAAESLEELGLSLCGLSAKSFEGLCAARLPALRRLSLHACAAAVTSSRQVNAFKHGGALPASKYGAAQWQRFVTSPLAESLQQLWITHFTLDKRSAEAIGGAPMPRLERLCMDGTRLGSGSLAALVGAGGLHTLEHLSLDAVECKKDSARAMTALVGAAFAARLRGLVLSRNNIDAQALGALFDGELRHLAELDLGYCGVGDAGCDLLAACELPLTHLRLNKNQITPAGAAALLESKLAPKLSLLSLWQNPLGDQGCRAILSSTRLTALERLSIAGADATDAILPALQESPLRSNLEVLQLHDNRLSDRVVEVLSALEAPRLNHIGLSNNGLTHEGVAALQSRLSGVKVSLSGQNPGKLPPEIVGSDHLKLCPLPESNGRPPTPTLPQKVRDMFAAPSWVGVERHGARYAFALKKTAGGYRVALVQISKKRVIEVDPPLEGPSFTYAVAPNHKHCGVLCESGAFVIECASGRSIRLGDALGDEFGYRIAWCGESLVVLDREADDPTRHRLDVYSRNKRSWERTHSLGGFPSEYCYMEPSAGHRLLIVKGRNESFFVAVRAGECRHLGSMHGSVETFTTEQVLRRRPDGRGKWVKEPPERTYVVASNIYAYTLTQIDEAIDAAFAAELPTR